MAKLGPFAGLVLFACLTATACSNRSSAESQAEAAPPPPPVPVVLGTRVNPDLPPEYRTVAENLAENWATSLEQLAVKPSPIESLAEAQAAGIVLKNIRSSDRDLQAIAEQAASLVPEVIACGQSLQAVPQQPTDMETFVAGFILGFAGDAQPLQQASAKAQHATTELERRLNEAGAVYDRAKATQLQLERVARRYSGPAPVSGTVVTVDFDDLWTQGEIESSDVISLTNCSQSDLTNCTVVVRIIGSSGESAKHVHFMADWKAGTKLYSEYVPGRFHNERMLFSETVYRPKTIEVSVYCDQLSVERMTYEYVGPERDRDIERWMPQIQLFGRYRPYSPGLLFTDQRSVIFSFSGVPHLLEGTATVTVRKGELSSAQKVPFVIWLEGKDLQADFPQLDWEADAFQIDLQFKDSGYSQAYNWRL